MPTALIVEDEPAANDLLSALVQLRGYRTDSAFTGTEALEKIGLRPPDVVFLDLMLPDIHGFEVCRSLKAGGSTRYASVVVVTARVAVENRIQSFRAGADDYIAKPYTPDQIFQALADAEDWRRAVEHPEAEGIVPLDLDDADESLRQLARLRGLVLARTPPEGDVVVRLGAFLIELWKSVDAWGRGHDTTGVARLAYRLDARGVSLEVLDGHGWLAADPMSREPGLRAAIEAARFRTAGQRGEKLYLSLADERSSPGRPDADPTEGTDPA
jgi:CheY-like chemotaxis protein